MASPSCVELPVSLLVSLELFAGRAKDAALVELKAEQLLAGATHRLDDCVVIIVAFVDGKPRKILKGSHKIAAAEMVAKNTANSDQRQSELMSAKVKCIRVDFDSAAHPEHAMVAYTTSLVVDTTSACCRPYTVAELWANALNVADAVLAKDPGKFDDRGLVKEVRASLAGGTTSVWNTAGYANSFLNLKKDGLLVAAMKGDQGMRQAADLLILKSAKETSDLIKKHKTPDVKNKVFNRSNMELMCGMTPEQYEEIVDYMDQKAGGQRAGLPKVELMQEIARLKDASERAAAEQAAQQERAAEQERQDERLAAARETAKRKRMALSRAAGSAGGQEVPRTDTGVTDSLGNVHGDSEHDELPEQDSMPESELRENRAKVRKVRKVEDMKAAATTKAVELLMPLTAEEIKDNWTCPLCSEVLNDPVGSTKCLMLHYHCRSCILSWATAELKKSKDPCCCVCKVPFDPESDLTPATLDNITFGRIVAAAQIADMRTYAAEAVV